MTSMVMILIFGFGLYLGIVPGNADLMDSKDLLLKAQAFFVQAFETSSDFLIQNGNYTANRVIEELTIQGKKLNESYQKVVSGFNFSKINSQCRNYTCGCCYHLVVEQISLNDTVCLKITYMVDDYKIQFTLKRNENTLIDTKISGKNPPPICIDIPYLRNLASLCLRLYDLDYADQRFTGCAALDFENVLGKAFEFGCFNIPPTVKQSLELGSTLLDKVF